ncbi:unnamed protein product [Closterium sp. Naga37s-1]|nr:unnamed protein product [Closterium sp. Naga37s-1]
MLCRPSLTTFPGWIQTLPIDILPPFTILTKGIQQEAVGKFIAKPVTLFAFPNGATPGCGLELAFSVNFTFALMPQSGSTGPSSFAFVIAAKAKAGTAARVGYGGVGNGSIAVVFNMDGSNQNVGLNTNGGQEPILSEPSPFTLTDGYAYKVWVDYEPGDPGTEGRIRVFLAGADAKPEQPLQQERLSLCAVLQGGVQQQAFSFGFVASTAVKPFQLLGILFSSVQTGFRSTNPKPLPVRDQALGLSISEATFAPSRASPFPRYVSSDLEFTNTKADSWRISDLTTWDSVDFLKWPVKNQQDCNACWAYAVVASVEAAYGIAKWATAPQLSVGSLFALMGLSDSDKCSAGGSPTEAFETLTALDASSGLTGASDPATTYPVQAFERAQFKGYVGLMLAVQRQPVVVHIEASARTFVMYDAVSM